MNTYLFVLVPICERGKNGGCDHICTDLDADSHECSCREGYQLLQDKMTCEKSKSVIFKNWTVTYCYEWIYLMIIKDPQNLIFKQKKNCECDVCSIELSHLFHSP